MFASVSAPGGVATFGYHGSGAAAFSMFDFNANKHRLWFDASAVTNGWGLPNSGLNFSSTDVAGGDPKVFLRYGGPANLRLGAADAAGSAIAINSVATNQLTLASNHGLTTGAAIIITGSVAPSGTSLNTRYYARVIAAAVIELYSTYDQATAASGTTGIIAVTTAGTSASVRLATPFQSFGVQDFTGTDIPGQPFILRGSRGTGTGPGGDLIFQVAPAGSSGTAQNALITGLTVRSVGTNNAGIFTPYLPNVGDSQSVIHGTSFGSTGNGPWVSGTQNGAYTISRMTTQSSGSIYFYTSSGNEIVQVFGTLGLGGIIQGPNVFLHGEATNTLALRNGANAQTFRVYNTWTSFGSGTEIWERGKFAWESNVLTIGTEKGANGGTARALEFQTNGLTRLTVETGGDVTITGNGLLRLRGSGAGALASTAHGNVVVTTSDGLGTTSILAFGNVTSSFPAIKRNSTALETKLADDSAYAPHAMQYLDVTDGVTAPASATGRARIYVDTADGDLKVIFADGTVKTIVTDT